MIVELTISQSLDREWYDRIKPHFCMVDVVLQWLMNEFGRMHILFYSIPPCISASIKLGYMGEAIPIPQVNIIDVRQVLFLKSLILN